MSAAEADYVIVGAGSAGCALAYRLSEAGASVLVVEYGGSDAGPLIQMPGALSFPMNMKRYDWGYRSEPEPHLGGPNYATYFVKKNKNIFLKKVANYVFFKNRTCNQDFRRLPSRIWAGQIMRVRFEKYKK